MSEGQAESRMKPAEVSGAPEAANVTDPSSLEARLMAARAKRALALAERKDGTGKTPKNAEQKIKAPAQFEPAVLPSVAEGARAPEELTPFAKKAVLVFIGATGLGLGGVLALGMLAGFGTLHNVPAFEAKTVALAPSDVAQSALLPAKTAPEALPAKEVSETPRLVGMIDKDLGEDPLPVTLASAFPHQPTIGDQSLDMPMISKVVYMHAETDADTALRLRSLPQAPDAIADDSVEFLLVDKTPRVFMHAPNGISDFSLQTLVYDLEKSGFDVSKIGREDFRVSSTHVRYFSPQSQDYAMTLANKLGIDARDFSQDVVIPGRIELWIAGRPKPVEVEEVEVPAPDSFARARALREIR